MKILHKKHVPGVKKYHAAWRVKMIDALKCIGL